MDHDTVSDAIAGQTLFIHGSRVDEGSSASITATSAAKKNSKKKSSSRSKKTKKNIGSSSSGAQTAKTERRQRRWRRLSENDGEKPRKTKKQNRRKSRSLSAEPKCQSACGSEDARDGLPSGTSTVCDPTCAAGAEGGARFDGFLCGAGDPDMFGDMCRLCYVCEHQARKDLGALKASSPAGVVDARAVIMCDTMSPPEPQEVEGSAVVVDAAAAGCSDECYRHDNAVSRGKEDAKVGSVFLCFHFDLVARASC